MLLVANVANLHINFFTYGLFGRVFRSYFIATQGLLCGCTIVSVLAL